MIKRWQMVLVVAFFGLIAIIGLVSGVSLSVAFTRATGWSIVVLGLLVVMERLFAGMVKPPEEADSQGQALDVTLPPESGEESEPTRAQTMAGNRQIDGDLEEMVRNDPVRVAELTKKMGLN